MSRVITGLTISLDGYAEDARGGVWPLYADLEALRVDEYMRELTAVPVRTPLTKSAADKPNGSPLGRLSMA